MGIDSCHEMRDELIDIWKGFLIFLVVLGHAVGMISHYTVGLEQSVCEFTYKVIYLFHMPAFFFVAGVLYKPGKITKWFRRLIVPYFIWSVASILVFLTFGTLISSNGSDGYYGSNMDVTNLWRPFVSMIHAGGWPNGEGFRCNSVLWFLPCMFVCLIAALFVKPRWCTILGCFVLGWIMRKYVQLSLPWGLSVMPRYLGFLLLGAITKDYARVVSPKWNLGWVAFVGLVLLLPNMYLAHVKVEYYLIELLFAGAGIVLSYAFAHSLKRLGGQFWALLGVNSLGIMLAHKFVLMAVVLVVKIPAVALVLSVVVSIAVSLGLSLALHKFCPLVIGEKYHAV